MKSARKSRFRRCTRLWLGWAGSWRCLRFARFPKDAVRIDQFGKSTRRTKDKSQPLHPPALDAIAVPQLSNERPDRERDCSTSLLVLLKPPLGRSGIFPWDGRLFQSSCSHGQSCHKTGSAARRRRAEQHCRQQHLPGPHTGGAHRFPRNRMGQRVAPGSEQSAVYHAREDTLQGAAVEHAISGVAHAARDFRLRADSPAFQLGFKAIPFEKIGLYQDELRASWPPPPRPE